MEARALSKNIRDTVVTPGWLEIVERANQAVKAAHFEALNEQDPAKYPEKHQIAWGASRALNTFIEQIEAESEGA